MRLRALIIFVLVCAGGFFPSPDILAQTEGKETKETAAAKLTLGRAVLCEEIFANAPRNQTVVFSVAKERAVCFTAFDTVPKKMFIYHNWFYRDIPSARIRLVLRPPSWSTYSSIQIRKTDIRPWRVEITDAQGNILHVLRFSITD